MKTDRIENSKSLRKTDRKTSKTISRHSRGETVPSDHHIFAIWLGLQAFYGLQLDLGLGLPVELHLIRQQSNLLSHCVNGLRRAGARDHNVTGKDRGSKGQTMYFPFLRVWILSSVLGVVWKMNILWLLQIPSFDPSITRVANRQVLPHITPLTSCWHVFDTVFFFFCLVFQLCLCIIQISLIIHERIT